MSRAVVKVMYNGSCSRAQETFVMDDRGDTKAGDIIEAGGGRQYRVTDVVKTAGGGRRVEATRRFWIPGVGWEDV